MARAINRLTAVAMKAIKAKKKPVRYADGGGLYLLVKPDNRRSWVFRYRDRATQKLRDKGLGPFPDVSLPMARERAAEARRALLDGADPIDSTREAKEAAKQAKAQEKTFGHCVGRYIAAKSPEWTNPKHRYQWGQMEAQCADIWGLPVAAVDSAAVLRVLEPLWTTKTETASRLRQRIERVLDWARTHGYRSGENPARWKGHLQNTLPSPKKVRTVTHMAAMPYAELPAFMARLWALESLSARSLALQILCTLRPGEAVGARWEEFDLEGALWTIPGARMKSGKEHTVPLTPRAVAMLKALPRDPSGFVFPSASSRKSAPQAITTAAQLKTLCALAPGLTAHGFRSTFRDWAGDSTNHPREVAEAALAHTLKDKTEAAYRRSSALEKRRQLMADWEAYCFNPKPVGNVSGIGEARAKKRKA